jgi:hypothetical protein
LAIAGHATGWQLARTGCAKATRPIAAAATSAIIATNVIFLPLMEHLRKTEDALP